MRRGKLKRTSVIIVVIAGFFALSSFFMDQQVIQKEDNIRNIEINIRNSIEKINNLETNSMSVLMLEDRVQMITNYYSFFSTIFYKIFLNLEKDNDFRKYFIKNAKKQISDFIKFDLNYILYDLTALRKDTLNMSFYYYEYENKEIQDKVQSLFLYNLTDVNESILKKLKNSYPNIESLNLTYNEVNEIYKSLFILNKELAVSILKLNDISNHFDKKEWEEVDKLDALSLDLKKYKNLKNYFILASIVFQILSLLALLFLFRSLIKERL